MRIQALPATLLAPLVLTLAACGGGDPQTDADMQAQDSAAAEASASASRAAALQRNVSQPAAGAAAASVPATTQTTGTASTVPSSQRIAAATATAESSSNVCAAMRPFYWEVGTRDGAAGSGSVGGNRVTANTPLHYASASKWLYGAYVVQLKRGELTTTDVQMLTFRSGYTSFSGCQSGQTVDACLATGKNGQYSAAADGRFSYSGGHMQKHASMNALGAMTPAGLGTALKSQLGSDLAITFSQAQPAGGAIGTPTTYALFLRKLLGGQLVLGAMLGSHAVCANPKACPVGEALASPLPAEDGWSYSLGHWVESDPETGDGAFSSAGTFGFYPWIDASRSHYGIVARVAPSGAGAGSAQCGRLIRQAFASGVAF